jgi:2-keto-4-pentenoate hydratase/2-oxohepta-3-ene-1,7-dioic acid hydratase in catechol pathway
MVETELVSGEAHAKGLDHEEGQVEERVVLGGSYSAAIPLTKASLAKAVSGCDAEVGNVVVVSRHSKGVSRGVVCILLMELLQDVSACYVFALACLLTIAFVTSMFLRDMLSL